MGLYIILMGVQGSGKGVQASFIRDHYRIPHVSTGDLFRAMKTRTDALARQIQQIMAEGKLISDDITNQVVQDRLQQDDARGGVILDGYPRTPVQADWLEAYLRSQGEAVTTVLLLELDLYDAFRRAFGRVTSADGSSYNIYSNSEAIDWQWVEHPQAAYPPRLEATVKASGEKLIRRPDDAHAHAIIKRIDTYIETTRPLIEYYRAKNLLKTVDASRSIEQVSADIQRIIDSAQRQSLL